jgi:hypothetical protein
MGKGVHEFQFSRDCPAGAEDHQVVVFLVKYVADHPPEEPVAWALAVGFSQCAGDEYCQRSFWYAVTPGDVLVGLLKCGMIKRRLCQENRHVRIPGPSACPEQLWYWQKWEICTLSLKHNGMNDLPHPDCDLQHRDKSGHLLLVTDESFV